MTTIRQFLAKKIFVNSLIHIDGWAILHIILFFYIGTQFPNKWMMIIVGSIIFEIIENIVSKRVTFLRENIKDTISDLGFNFIGYFAGMKFIGAI